MDNQKTLTFLQELCEAADVAVKAGDLSLAKRLGQNGATQFYFTNVHKIPTMTPKLFAQNYPQFMQEADRIRVAYETDEARDQRINTIEAQLGELKDMVKQLLEAREEVAAVESAEPEKKPRKAKKEETEEAPDDEAEDEAE